MLSGYSSEMWEESRTEPEQSFTYGFDNDSSFTVWVEKVGGGEIAEYYSGLWRVEIQNESGEIVFQTNSLYTGTPKSHSQVARIALDFHETAVTMKFS